MTEDFNKPGSDNYIAGEGVRMNRSKALHTMGAMAAGVPFIQRVITGLTPSDTATNQVSGKVPDDPVLAKAISELEYLTPADKFIVQRRGQPVLSEIPADKLTAIGLTRETWKLEILPDPESNSEIGNPLTREKGNAVAWSDLMKLAREANRTIPSPAHLHKCSQTLRHGLMGRCATSRTLLEG